MKNSQHFTAVGSAEMTTVGQVNIVMRNNGDTEWWVGNELVRRRTQRGLQEWFKNGMLHRDGDEPARIFPRGEKEWWKNGERHRSGDKPALVGRATDVWFSYSEEWVVGKAFFCDNAQEWWVNGKLHREGDKPAKVSGRYVEEWWVNGMPHREGDKPARIWDGKHTQEWIVNGKFHREGDKPARIEMYGATQEWYLHGERHRSNGKPAFMTCNRDGKNRSCIWYINNIPVRGPKRVFRKRWEKYLEPTPSSELKNSVGQESLAEINVLDEAKKEHDEALTLYVNMLAERHNGLTRTLPQQGRIKKLWDEIDTTLLRISEICENLTPTNAELYKREVSSFYQLLKTLHNTNFGWRKPEL